VTRRSLATKMLGAVASSDEKELGDEDAEASRPNV